MQGEDAGEGGDGELPGGRGGLWWVLGDLLGKLMWASDDEYPGSGGPRGGFAMRGQGWSHSRPTAPMARSADERGGDRSRFVATAPAVLLLVLVLAEACQ